MVMLLGIEGIRVLEPVTFTLRFVSDSQLNRVNVYCSPQPPSILRPPPSCLSDVSVMGTITESTDELVADWAPVEDRRAAAHATSLGVRVWFLSCQSERERDGKREETVACTNISLSPYYLRRQRIWESPSLCCRRCSFCCPRQKMTPLFCCPCNTLVSPRMPSFYQAPPLRNSLRTEQISAVARVNSEFLGAVDLRSKHQVHWGFVGASRIQYRPKVSRIVHHRRAFRPSACWLTSSQIANDAFTWGTVSVLPFYTLMVLAPNAALTRRTMESNLPYVALGVVYAYLLYLSWTPDTFSTMFASKYWLPELSGIAKMFSNEMTMASAWIHLLAVDLFAARQVFHDGLKNNVETRHSVSLCLLFCPVGIFSHFITKSLTKMANRPH